MTVPRCGTVLYSGPLSPGRGIMSVQSVERAIQILQSLAAHPAGVSDTARLVGLPKSTVARLLSTLEDQGAVERVGDGQAFRVGPAMRQIAGGVAGPNLESLSRPHLVHLVREVGEAAGFSVPQGFDALYLLQIDADHDVQVRDWTGAALPMHLVSAGLVMLAAMSDEQVDEYLELSLDSPTTKSVVDPVRIRDRLVEVRASGVAWVRDELVDGLTSVAVGVSSADGDLVGAVHVHGPSFRFPRKGAADVIVDALNRTAVSVSLSLDQTR